MGGLCGGRVCKDRAGGVEGGYGLCYRRRVGVGYLGCWVSFWGNIVGGFVVGREGMNSLFADAGCEWKVLGITIGTHRLI